MKKLHIDLAVLDGINAMEGNGPTQGNRINAGCVIASTDFVAADRIALEIMEINPDNVGYLNYLYELGFGELNLNKIEIKGDELEKKKFKLHDTVEEQYNWRQRIKFIENTYSGTKNYINDLGTKNINEIAFPRTFRIQRKKI